MGKYDLVEAVLAEFQAEFFFTGVFIQPGKPAVFGRVPGGRGRSPASRRLLRPTFISSDSRAIQCQPW